MIMICDYTLVSTKRVAVDICANNVIEGEVDLEFGLDHPQPLFYFVPQDSHNQAGSTKFGP